MLEAAEADLALEAGFVHVIARQAFPEIGRQVRRREQTAFRAVDEQVAVEPDRSHFAHRLRHLALHVLEQWNFARFKAWLRGSKVVKGPQADVDAIAAE